MSILVELARTHFTHCISVFFSLACFLSCLVLAPFLNLITGFTVSLRLRSVWPGLTQAACRQQNDFWFVFDSYSGDEPLMTRWLVFAWCCGFSRFVLRVFRGDRLCGVRVPQVWGCLPVKKPVQSQSSNKPVQQETWKRELYYTWQTESYNPSGYSMRYSFKIEKITQNRTNSIGFRSEMFRCMSFDFVPSFRMFQYLWIFNPYFFRLWGNKWCCKKVAMTHIDTQDTPYTTAFAPEDFYTIPFTTFYTKQIFYAKCLRHQIPFTPNTFQTRKLLRQTTWVATWEKNISFACSRQIFPSVLNVW